MKLNSINKVKSGKYLNNYELNYTNKAGREKTFEIVSYNEINDISDIGNKISGVIIVAVKNNKLLLLREFRMGVNKYIYNLCAGRIEKDESIEECIRRELFEETGLSLVYIKDILPAAYPAVALSDVSNVIAFVEVDGDISDNTSDNEEIKAGFYSKEAACELIKNYPFASIAQIVTYSFINGNMN